MMLLKTINHPRITVKTFYIILLIKLIVIIYFCVFTCNSDHPLIKANSSLPAVMYLIDTPGCRIVDTDPFNKEAMSFVEKLPKVQCSKHSPLILSNQTSIWINEKARESMKLPKTIKCCYTPVWRGSPDKAPKLAVVDKLVEFGDECIQFNESANVSDEFVEVTCEKDGKNVYTDYHAFIVPKRTKDVLPRKKKHEKPSVLIIGMDSVSRLNLYRQMPKTYKLMKKLGAIELMGFNKVGDNTFPNILPLFTGKSIEELKTSCWRDKTDYFDNCTYLWNYFGAKNYLTAFGEDTCWMGLFLYLTSGFRKQPTDYYTQPYMEQSEGKIGHQKKGNANLCSGPRLALDVLFDYANQFVLNMTAEDLPFWAHFWGTSLSHDYLNVPPNADDIYESLFESFRDNDVFENTFVIFMSDHGIRWGSFRETHQGYVEERLPFVFFIVPKWIQKEYPTAIDNLRVNTQRLTTHFDLHHTLLDILNIENLADPFRVVSSNNSMGTSLLKEVPIERTCNSSGIPEHFCACHLNEEISTTDFKVNMSALRVVKHINQMLKGHLELCALLSLDKIISSRIGTRNDASKELLIVVSTAPGGAMFEATTIYNQKKNTTEVNGFVSRINAYGNDSYCVNEDKIKLLKLYCYCNTFLL